LAKKPKSAFFWRLESDIFLASFPDGHVLLKPHSLSINGDKIRGILAENRNGEYFYHALFENVHAGEEKALSVIIEGECTIDTLKEDGYYGNFAWNTPHIQRIVFPKRWRILSATPNGYVLKTFEGLPAVKWVRNGEFWGEVQVKAVRD
jgi:hypothetical protein